MLCSGSCTLDVQNETSENESSDNPPTILSVALMGTSAISLVVSARLCIVNVRNSRKQNSFSAAIAVPKKANFNSFRNPSL